MGRLSNEEKARRAALAAGQTVSEGDGQPEKVASAQDTPEFKAAVQDAVNDLLPTIVASLAKARDGRDASNVDIAGDGKWAQGLAMAIAEISDQGVGRKRVAPEIIKARQEAREEMTRLLVEARAGKVAPVYGLRNKVYLDEQLIDPIYIDPASKEQRNTEIEWWGVPNDVMVPVNDVAQGIHNAFMDSIGSVARDDFDKPALGVTAGGLVIRSRSASVRPVQAIRADDPAAAPDAAAIERGEGGLRVPHRGNGGQYIEKRVLGTVAPPARQTA